MDAQGGFDGGDGQVGVVGDGSNAMEEFDNRGIVDNTVGGRGKVSGASKTNRIDKRWAQWGAGASLSFPLSRCPHPAPHPHPSPSLPPSLPASNLTRFFLRAIAHTRARKSIAFARARFA